MSKRRGGPKITFFLFLLSFSPPTPFFPTATCLFTFLPSCYHCYLLDGPFMSDIQPEPEILVSDRYHSPNDSIDETLPTLFDQMPSLHQQPQQQHQELQTQPADNTEQAGNENDNDDEGCHLLTAAGLTRAMETNQGQPLTEIINISTANPSHLFW